MFYLFPQPLRENFDDNQPAPNSRTRYRCPVKNVKKNTEPFSGSLQIFSKGLTYFIPYSVWIFLRSLFRVFDKCSLFGVFLTPP